MPINIADTRTDAVLETRGIRYDLSRRKLDLLLSGFYLEDFYSDMTMAAVERSISRYVKSYSTLVCHI